MRKLAWLGMRRRKKQMYTVLTAVVLSMVFFLSIAIVRESVTATVRQDRLETYGMWTGAFYNASEMQRESLGKEPFVENIGEMQIYGTILDEKGKETGGIGTMDKEMIRLGQIHLKEGSLPQKDNEIAMEEKTLKRLGIEERLGTEVKVRVYHDTAKGEEEELSFVLCGILKDYSSKWKRDYSQLITGVVSEVREPEKSHLFFYGREYEEIQKVHKLDTLVKTKQDGSLTVNNLAYEKDKVFLEKVLENDLLTVFLTMISAVVIIYIQLIQFQGRRNTLLTMRGIGSSKGQILSMLLWEDVYVLRYALPLGGVLGMCIPCAALYFTGFQVVVSIGNAVSVILISAGVFLAGTSGLYLSVRNLDIEASFRAESNVTKRKHFPKIRKVKALTPVRMMTRKRKFEGRKSVIRSMILLVGSVAAILGVVSTIHFLKEYRNIGKNTEADYEWQALKFGMDYADMEEVRTTDGIRKTEFRIGVDSDDGWESGIRVNWKGIEESSYIEDQDLLIQDWIHAYGVEILEDFDSDLGRYYLSCLEENTVDQEAFIRGEEVILVLPAYVKKGGEIRSVSEEELPYVESIQEEMTVSVGDNVHIFQPGTEDYCLNKTVRVGGVIRVWKEETPKLQQLAYRPGDIIVSPEFRYNDAYYEMAEVLEGEKCGGYLYAYADENGENELLDEKFKDLIPERLAAFTNHRAERKAEQERLLSYAILCVGSMLLVVTICGLILVGGQKARLRNDRKKNRTFRQMGMERKDFLKLFLMETMMDSIGAFILGMIVTIVTYAFFLYIQTPVNSVSGVFSLVWDTMMWKAVLVTEVVYFFLYIGINAVVLRRSELWESF